MTEDRLYNNETRSKNKELQSRDSSYFTTGSYSLHYSHCQSDERQRDERDRCLPAQVVGRQTTVCDTSLAENWSSLMTTTAAVHVVISDPYWWLNHACSSSSFEDRRRRRRWGRRGQWGQWRRGCRAGLTQSAALFQLHISQQPPLPSSSSLSTPLLPFPSRPLLKSVGGLGSLQEERCKLPQRPQSHFAVLYARKTHLVAAFLGAFRPQHVGPQ